MKYFIVITTFLISLVFLISTPIYAHDLESSSKMGAVLHIEPNDQPRAQESTSITLEFNGDNHDDAINNCECSTKILTGEDEVLFEKQFSELTFLSENKLSFNYIFPEAGWFKLVAVGTHRGDKFELSYEILVEPSKIQNSADTIPTQNIQVSPISQNLMPVYFCCLLLLALGVIGFFLLNKNKKTIRKSKKL